MLRFGSHKYSQEEKARQRACDTSAETRRHTGREGEGREGISGMGGGELITQHSSSPDYWRGAVTSDGRHDPERGTVTQSSWSTLSYCGPRLDTSLTRTGTFFLNWSAAGLTYRLSHACLECFMSGLPQKNLQIWLRDHSRTTSLTQTRKTDHVLTFVHIL